MSRSGRAALCRAEQVTLVLADSLVLRAGVRSPSGEQAAQMSQTAVSMRLTAARPGQPALALARWSTWLVMSAVWLAGGGVRWTGAPKLGKVMVSTALPLPPVLAAGTGV
jgi:hypothetical protein